MSSPDPKRALAISDSLAGPGGNEGARAKPPSARAVQAVSLAAFGAHYAQPMPQPQGLQPVYAQYPGPPQQGVQYFAPASAGSMASARAGEQRACVAEQRLCDQNTSMINQRTPSLCS